MKVKVLISSQTAEVIRFQFDVFISYLRSFTACLWRNALRELAL